MAIPSISSIAAEASRATELKVQKPPSTISEQSQAKIEPDCPLHGADYDSITHLGREITTLRLRKEYFEEADQGIVEYSELLTTENDKLDIVLSEKMVNHLYTIQVLALWSFDSPMAEKLLSQTDCPLMRRFWEMRTSPETFSLRNSNVTHNEFRWSQSKPTIAQKAIDKGMIMVENRSRKVAVPMIGIISQLEELDFTEVRKEIKNANRRISTSTVVTVLEGVLQHIYYDPLQAVREERLKEIETIRARGRKTHRTKGAKPDTAGQETGEPSSLSKISKIGAPAVATQEQTSTKEPTTDISNTPKEV